jgi:hypothetical protein
LVDLLIKLELKNKITLAFPIKKITPAFIFSPSTENHSKPSFAREKNAR